MVNNELCSVSCVLQHYFEMLPEFRNMDRLLFLGSFSCTPDSALAVSSLFPHKTFAFARNK